MSLPEKGLYEETRLFPLFYRNTYIIRLQSKLTSFCLVKQTCSCEPKKNRHCLRLWNICKYARLWATLGPLLLPLPVHNADSGPSSGAIHFRFRLPYDIYGAHRTRSGPSPSPSPSPFPSTCPLFSIQSVALCLSPGPRGAARENGKLRASLYSRLLLLLRVCPPAVSVMSTHPFHAMPFSILSPSVVFLVCMPCPLCVLVLSGSPGLHSAWLVIFCTCSRLEYFMGLSAFS